MAGQVSSLMFGLPAVILITLGSFLEFIGAMELMKTKYSPEELPFHLIVPSMPGYAYSSGPPPDKNFGCEEIAETMDKLMVGLGFDSYIAQGGDIGAVIARLLVAKSDHCRTGHGECSWRRSVASTDAAQSTCRLCHHRMTVQLKNCPKESETLMPGQRISRTEAVHMPVCMAQGRQQSGLFCRRVPSHYWLGERSLPEPTSAVLTQSQDW